MRSDASGSREAWRDKESYGASEGLRLACGSGPERTPPRLSAYGTSAVTVAEILCLDILATTTMVCDHTETLLSAQLSWLGSSLHAQRLSLPRTAHEKPPPITAVRTYDVELVAAYSASLPWRRQAGDARPLSTQPRSCPSFCFPTLRHLRSSDRSWPGRRSCCTCSTSPCESPEEDCHRDSPRRGESMVFRAGRETCSRCLGRRYLPSVRGDMQVCAITIASCQ